MYTESAEQYEKDEKNYEEKREFDERFANMDSGTKGRWAEVATINEADEAKQVVLVDHPDNPNKHGFDCVSIDPETSRLHIWEAKNYGENTSLRVNNLTAWKDTENGQFKEGFIKNVKEVINSVPEGNVRDIVRRSVAEGNVTYHLRVGPDTNISNELEAEIQDSLPEGADFDIKSYSPEYMNRFDDKLDYKNSIEKQEHPLEQAKPLEVAGTSEWLEKGIIDVPVNKIDISDSQVKESSDFHKVPKEDMILGLEKLENEIRPAVREGATGDDFSNLDQKLELDYANGYRRIYDAFYGNEPIRLEKDGENYSVTNGYHRIQVAKELGLETIPASVLERELRR